MAARWRDRGWAEMGEIYSGRGTKWIVWEWGMGKDDRRRGGQMRRRLSARGRRRGRRGPG
jgi:hypothetical protein